MNIFDKYKKVFDNCYNVLVRDYKLDAETNLKRIKKDVSDYCGYFQVLYNMGELTYSEYAQLFNHVSSLSDLAFQEVGMMEGYENGYDVVNGTWYIKKLTSVQDKEGLKC